MKVSNSNTSEGSSQDSTKNHPRRKGNNSYGAKGTPKCPECRRQKQKCIYTNPEDTCVQCEHHHRSCGPKEYASARYGQQQSQTTARRMASAPYRIPSRPRPDVDLALSSPPPARLSDIAIRLQQLHPEEDVHQIHHRAGEYIGAMSQDPMPAAVPVNTGAHAPRSLTSPAPPPAVDENAQTMDELLQDHSVPMYQNNQTFRPNALVPIVPNVPGTRRTVTRSMAAHDVDLGTAEDYSGNEDAEYLFTGPPE